MLNKSRVWSLVSFLVGLRTYQHPVFRNKQTLSRNTRKGEREGAYRVLVTIPEGKTSLGRPRTGWEGNIKTDLQDVGWGEGMDWIDQAQERDRWRALVNTVVNLRVP
jgi:hypothetical protein